MVSRLLEESLLRVYFLQLIPASVDVKTLVVTAQLCCEHTRSCQEIMVSDFGTCNRGSVPDFRQLSPSPSGATNFIHLFCYTTLRSKNITNFDKFNELLKSSMEKTITLDSGLQFHNISQLLCLRHIMQNLGRACGSCRPSSPSTNWHLMKSYRCCSVECCFAANFKNSFSSSAKADCFWYLSDSLIEQRHSNSNPHELPSTNFDWPPSNTPP